MGQYTRETALSYGILKRDLTQAVNNKPKPARKMKRSQSGVRTKMNECPARVAALYDMSKQKDSKESSKPNSPVLNKKKKLSCVFGQEGMIPHAHNPLQKKLLAAHRMKSPVPNT